MSEGGNQRSDVEYSQLEEKEKLWTELHCVIENIPRGERMVIGAALNGHVGEENRGDEEVMG